MPSRKISDLCQELQPLVMEGLKQCHDEGIHVILTCTYRSDEEQNDAYARGRTKPGKIITNAKSGQSPHNCKLPDGTPAAKGFDIAIKGDNGQLDWNASDERWKKTISIFQSLGLVSGSQWRMKDNPHFELKDWG